jgi:hypothetical protein
MDFSTIQIHINSYSNSVMHERLQLHFGCIIDNFLLKKKIFVNNFC